MSKNKQNELLLINENKSNNFDVKSNNELFKQALVEGLNRRFDREIEEAKKIEQIEEMIEIVKPFVSGLACEEESGSCELTDCRSCNARDLSNKLYNAGHQKQSEGEWIDRYKGKFANSLYVCSICDGKSLLANHMNELFTPTVKQILTPYCPHCGAKMKGGEE